LASLGIFMIGIVSVALAALCALFGFLSGTVDRPVKFLITKIFEVLFVRHR